MNKIFVLKGRNKAIVFSLFVHLLIFFLISQTVVVPSLKKQIKPEAIKSFLYTPPKNDEEIIDLNEKINVEEDSIDELTSPTQPIEKSTQVIDEIEPKLPSTTKQETTEEPEKTKQVSPSAKPTKTFSAFSQLKNLKESLNNQFIEQKYSEFSRHKSASIMHGKPDLVPHSKKQFSDEEIKKKTSKQISSDILITKGDNGSCFIERDLSIVGMEGLKSREGFACGKSKFDKNFQEHMKKVREKLGK